MNRQVILDTETTGLEPGDHRIIEIGCVEMVNRRLTGKTFHQYLQPDRVIDAGAIEVHGITNEFLADKPRFADVAEEFMDFIRGAELVIHNAPFDVGFINAELARLGQQWGRVTEHCTVLDTLVMARKLHPGQKNNLDALCKRYDVDNSNRELHGALLDSEILADVYLAMTGGQTALSLEGSGEEPGGGPRAEAIRRLDLSRPRLKVIYADYEELQAHEQRLAAIEESCGDKPVWLREASAAPETTH